jgi:hypothetical protein
MAYNDGFELLFALGTKKHPVAPQPHHANISQDFPSRDAQRRNRLQIVHRAWCRSIRTDPRERISLDENAHSTETWRAARSAFDNYLGYWVAPRYLPAPNPLCTSSRGPQLRTGLERQRSVSSNCPVIGLPLPLPCSRLQASNRKQCLCGGGSAPSGSVTPSLGTAACREPRYQKLGYAFAIIRLKRFKSL